MDNNRAILFLISIIAVFFVGVILHELRVVLMPFVVAMLLSIIFKPIVLYSRSRGVPTAAALLVVLIAISLFLFLLGWTVYASTSVMIAELPRYEHQALQLVETVQSRVIALATSMGVEVTDNDWTQAVDMTAFTGVLTSGIGSFLGFAGFVFLVLMFMMFILAGSGDLARKVRVHLPPKEADRMATIVAKVDRQVRTYLIAKTLMSLGNGITSWFALAMVGVDFALVWGFLTVVLSFIPNFGSLVAVAAPVLLAGLQFHSFGVAVLVFVLLFISENVWSIYIEPRMMGFRLDLSPLLILMSLIFWGWLWGVWGMVLAVPLTASIKILFENVESLRPLAALMGGVGNALVPAEATIESELKDS